MAVRIRAHEWAPTPLGPIERWSHVLRTAVDIMLAMPGPATILWGPQYVQLYNDAYITIARDRHPLLLGRPVAEGWAEAYGTVIAPLLESARAGRATQLTNFPVPLHGPDGPEERVFDTDWVPIRDEFGAVAGALQTLAEATDRLKAQTAMRESEARHRLLIGSWAQAVWETNAHGVVIADSPSWRAYTGQTLQEWLGYGWLDAIHPDDRRYAERQWREATAAHGLVNAEFRLRDPNGGWRWTNVRAAPVLDAGGDIEKWVGMNIDIDTRKRAEAALRESEDRQRALIEGVPQLVWRASDTGQWTWSSPQWTEFTGQGEGHSRGWGWLAPLHAKDRKGVREAWAQAIERGIFKADYRIRDRQGAYRWFQTRATPIRDESGTIIEWLGTSSDVDDLRSLQERQRILVAELQHRTFNLMGMVRSMADATIRSSANLGEFKVMFGDRISALARVQRLLSRLREDDRITFDELVRSELDAVGALQGGDSRVTLHGPEDVTLRSSIVQTFAMALHELTTNAVKYGALKQPKAHLDVCWRVEIADDGQPWLHVDWIETGVFMPAPDGNPKGGGQGRRLIEEALPYQFKAKTTYVIENDGIRCAIALPLSTRSLAEINHTAQ